MPLTKIAPVLRTISDRHFQVTGDTDNMTRTLTDSVVNRAKQVSDRAGVAQGLNAGHSKRPIHTAFSRRNSRFAWALAKKKRVLPHQLGPRLNDCDELNQIGNPHIGNWSRRHRTADVIATSQTDLVTAVPLIVIRGHRSTPVSHRTPVPAFQATTELRALR